MKWLYVYFFSIHRCEIDENVRILVLQEFIREHDAKSTKYLEHPLFSLVRKNENDLTSPN